ncbi:hypothetical protein [Hyphomonas sp.]|uniref:hypothetical protein n=1 Tax=Hyphomonas sp. TaxID=87 RepID=UPI0025C3079D|nr:hypothetical protein [Hyphomonas sp.]|tara:strand:+ start:29 stop:382 length:354 start_codon:yes stop_codon:yes gene_type:complete
MALITLTFSGTINTSVQINDIVYAVNTVSLGGFNTGSSNDITILGPVTSVTTNTVVYDDTASGNQPSAGDFIMFSKDNTVNMTSLLGYFARVQLTNNDVSNHGELFSLEAGYDESSK